MNCRKSGSCVKAVSGRGGRSLIILIGLAYWRTCGSLTKTSGGKKGKRNGLKGENEREETGTLVDPQAGELARGYAVLIYCT